MTNKERFIELLRSTKREGIEKLIDFLEKTDFFTAPAAQDPEEFAEAEPI